MKKLLFLAVALSLVAACGNSANSKKAKAAAAQEAAAQEAAAAGNVYKLDDLLAVADQLVGKEVTVIGHITHTCKHSGKRCFIVDDSQATTFRVEAKGNIGGFNRELTGAKVAIKGIVRESRMTKEYLAQMEKDITEKKLVEDGSAESCATELANLADMKKWMAEHGKDYYAIYYMDGEDYEVVDE